VHEKATSVSRFRPDDVPVACFIESGDRLLPRLLRQLGGRRQVKFLPKHGANRQELHRRLGQQLDAPGQECGGVPRGLRVRERQGLDAPAGRFRNQRPGFHQAAHRRRRHEWATLGDLFDHRHGMLRQRSGHGLHQLPDIRMLKRGQDQMFVGR
jgi:hypothetical protein